MFIMKAPFPQYSVTTVMPSPKFGNSEFLKASVLIMRTMDGTVYSYVMSRNNLRSLKWDFTISLDKADELSDFINIFYGSKIHFTDHNGDTFIGYLKNNPVDFVGAGRAKNLPGEEDVNVTLEIEETE